MSPATRKKVENFAFYSRILVFLAQVLFNFVIPDHNAKVFNPPNIHKKKWLDYYANILFEGFRRWDGVYFHHIAEHGYTYENTLAFFPLFPMLVRLIANTAFYPLQFIISYNIVLTISAFAINFFIFIKSASVLYELSLFVLKDETLAFKTAQLYSINPASIFFSAVYSETLFAYLAFKAMFFIERKRLIRSSLLFGLSGLTRSNGLVNIGFIVYQKFIDVIDIMKSVQNTKFINKRSRLLAILTYFLLVLGHLTIQVTFAILPFLLYQYYSYTVFCDKNATYKDLKVHILNYGNTQEYKMPHTGLSKWCHSSYPISYTYVQDHHWDVGFMRYWEYIQWPNFILATPIAMLSLGAIVNYVRRNTVYSVTLGLYKPKEDVFYYKKMDEVEKRVGFHQHCVYVYIVHLLFMVTFGVFFMHVQVITRFICSSSPVVYWYIAHLTTPPEKLQPQTFEKEDTPYSPLHMQQQHNNSEQQEDAEFRQVSTADTNVMNMNSSEGDNHDNQTSENQHDLVHTCSLGKYGQNGHSNNLLQSDPKILTEELQHRLTNNRNSDGGGGSSGGGSVNMNSSNTAGVNGEDTSVLDLDDMYDWDSNSWIHKLIFVYMHLYFFVGIAAFSNFLPWT